MHVYHDEVGPSKCKQHVKLQYKTCLKLIKDDKGFLLWTSWFPRPNQSLFQPFFEPWDQSLHRYPSDTLTENLRAAKRARGGHRKNMILTGNMTNHWGLGYRLSNFETQKYVRNLKVPSNLHVFGILNMHLGSFPAFGFPKSPDVAKGLVGHAFLAPEGPIGVPRQHRAIQLLVGQQTISVLVMLTN